MQKYLKNEISQLMFITSKPLKNRILPTRNHLIGIAKPSRDTTGTIVVLKLTSHMTTM